jgi:hypothetical protein
MATRNPCVERAEAPARDDSTPPAPEAIEEAEVAVTRPGSVLYRQWADDLRAGRIDYHEFMELISPQQRGHRSLGSLVRGLLHI